MKISIALCTYNGEKYLKKQLESYLKQTRLPDEIVICDDQSKDSTITILEEFKLNIGIPVFIFQNSPSLGVIANFEKAISLCNGDIIFLSDQDDIWEPDKTEKILQSFVAQPEALMIFSNGRLIDHLDNSLDSTLWEKWGFTEQLKLQWKDNEIAFNYLLRNDNKITGATAAIHKDLKKHIFPFTVPLGFWHDAWLGIYAARYSGLFYIDQPLIRYRVHPNQLVGLGNGTSINPKRKTLIHRIISKINSLKNIFY